MSFLRNLAEFFESIFMSSNPEVKKRQALRKIESELKGVRPSVYNNGMVTVNFAEAVRILYVNTKPIADLLSNTICSDDIKRNGRYEEQLLLTGFPSEIQDIIEGLEYENRKKGASEAPSQMRYFENEHRELEKVIKQMNTKEFVQIDHVIDVVRQIYDVCNFGYMTTLRIFDVSFSSMPNYKSNFQDIPADLLETALLDLYYVIADLEISNSVGMAILACAELQAGGDIGEGKKNSYLNCLRKIQTVRHQVFTNATLEKLIRLSKKNPEFVPPKATYRSNARQNYAKYLQEKFVVDQGRLKVEIQDETITAEVQSLFGDIQMENVRGYNKEMNYELKQSSSASFEWIVPVQVLKSFIKHYYINHIKPLLNDIVIEGFFGNPAYKSEFSTVVYAANDTMERIEKFESQFEHGGQYDEGLITGFIRDSHKDNGFALKLKELVDNANKEAKALIQTETTNLNHMYKLISEIIVESKKPSTESIGNLKVLMMSSRNRDNSEFMESKAEQWVKFLEIMKNYVIITSIEK